MIRDNRMPLTERVHRLLAHGRTVYAGNRWASDRLRQHDERIPGPLRLAVVGSAESDRSTLVQALIGGSLPANNGGVMLPGSASALSHVEITTIDKLPVDRDDETGMGKVMPQADAILHVLRDPYDVDREPLRTVDHPGAGAAPVDSLAVLIRADELGGGRSDSLTAARRMAHRSSYDLELRSRYQEVVAVADLVGGAGQTLTQEEFDLLATWADMPGPELDSLLLSVDRFGADGERRQLLDRLGLFGLRLATTLIRGGIGTRAALAEQLMRHSGIDELYDALAVYFVARADILKARSALIGLDTVLRHEPCSAAAPLAAELERVFVGAHEFRELRLLAELRTGRAELPEELRAEALWLVTGGSGVRTGTRAPDPELRPALMKSLHSWQTYRESPVLSISARRTAAEVVRMCEARIAELST